MLIGTNRSAETSTSDQHTNLPEHTAGIVFHYMRGDRGHCWLWIPPAASGVW